MFESNPNHPIIRGFYLEFLVLLSEEEYFYQFVKHFMESRPDVKVPIDMKCLIEDMIKEISQVEGESTILYTPTPHFEKSFNELCRQGKLNEHFFGNFRE